MSRIIGIGTEIIECLRVARMIERHGEQFINRVYTAEEIRYCRSRRQATQHFAGRWAAKQAVLKALGTNWQRGLSWRDIEIRPAPARQAVVAVRGAMKDLIKQLKVAQLLVGISHCHTHAMACAVAVGRETGRAE